MTLAELGSILKDKREELGFSVDDISERIKVSMRIIKLIEEGNDAGLPHSVYTRGFIISYAEVLQIDKDELLTQLDLIFPSEDIEEMQPAPQVISPNQRRGVWVKQLLLCVILLAIVGGIAFGGWFIVNNFGTDIVDMVKKPFAASSSPEEASSVAMESSVMPETPANTTSMQTQNSGYASLQVGGAEGQRATVPSEEQADAIILPQNTSHEATSLVGDGESVGTHNAEENVVVISPRAPCWTRVIADKKQILEKTITPGNNFTFNYTKNATILLGNPSGVSLTINGKPYTGNLRSSQTLTIHLPL